MSCISLMTTRSIAGVSCRYNAAVKVLLKTKVTKNVGYYSSYSCAYLKRSYISSRNIASISRPAFVCSARLNSSNASSDSVGENYIPAPPESPPPDILEDVVANVQTASELLEPTFASQGLCNYTPIGLIQSAFEFLHVSAGMPWWLTIAVGTVVVRICMFPLVIKGQQYSGKMHKNLPQMQVLQHNMTEARKSGDHLQAIRASNDLAQFIQDKQINPMKQMLIPMCQAPVFISFFVSLRQMANLPVESLMHGGLFWFVDLTISDPYYLLPVLTSATLFLTIEIGADGMRADTLGAMKYVLRAMPIFILPFTVNFPAAILCYWFTSNILSLGQVTLLKIPSVRKYFNIPVIAKHAPSKLPESNKGFITKFKENWSNQRLIKEMEERHRIDDVKFRKSGLGPIEKTYPYNPTKQRPPKSK